MRHNQSTKLKKLMERYHWGGDLEEFTQFLKNLINRMPTIPQDIMSVMWRYYIEDDSQRKDALGKVDPTDRDFYTNLQIGRCALDTIMNFDTTQLKDILVAKQKGLW